MPSPIAHLALIIAVPAFVRSQEKFSCTVNSAPFFFYAASAIALCAPDLDFMFRAVYPHPLLEHGGATHSLSIGILFAVLFTAACRMYYGASLPVAPTLVVGLACVWSHAMMDVVTRGRGAMILWPFSEERIASPIPLFFGAHHSQPLAWRLHLVTLGTELLFAAAVWWLVKRLWPNRR